MMKSFLRKAQLVQASANATQEPNQVVGLTATASGQTTINLSWTADATPSPNGATSYVVERSVDGLGSWSTIATGITTNSYSDTSLSASQTRYYRVSAYNFFGGGLPSASANATTAAGGVSPSWSLDFSSGTPSGYTLTRASTGTYVDSSGYIASASTDIARLTHNSSGSRLGLLVEGQRTNLVQRSGEFENAYWNVLDAVTCAGVASPGAPDNSTDAAEMKETTASNCHRIERASVGVTAGTVTWSCYLKKQSRQYAGIYIGTFNNGYYVLFDLTNGQFSADRSVGTPNGTNSIEAVGNGWYRCSLTMNTGGSGTVTTFPGVFLSDRAGFTGTLTNNVPSYIGSTSESVYVWGLQFEGAATLSSYIPTTTASVTRSADLVHVLDSAITNWGSPGALVVHFYPPSQAGTLLSTDDASTAQVGIEASTTTAARAFWSSGSTATGTIGSGVQKAVHYWTGSTSKFCINGGTVESGTNNLTISNTDFVTLGAEATDSSGVPGTFSQYANCIIRKVEFYSGTLTDANLQTITT